MNIRLVRNPRLNSLYIRNSKQRELYTGIRYYDKVKKEGYYWWLSNLISTLS